MRNYVAPQHGCEVEPNQTAAEAASNGPFTLNENHCGAHNDQRDYFMFQLPDNASGTFTVQLLTTAGTANQVQLQLRDDATLSGSALTYVPAPPYLIVWPATPGHRYYAYIYTNVPDAVKTYTLRIEWP